RFDQVARDVDAEHVGAEPRLGQRRGSVAAADVEHAHAAGDAQRSDQRLAASAHALGDAREVAFFPQRLIRIHVPSYSVTVAPDPPIPEGRSFISANPSSMRRTAP